MEFSYRNILPFHSGKIIKKTIWINFNFSIWTYFKTFCFFIIKLISISKCFLFYFAKNVLVYRIFFLKEEKLKHLEISRLQLAPYRILAQCILKISSMYHDMKEKQIYIENTNIKIIMKLIMLPQWDINVLSFKYAI